MTAKYRNIQIASEILTAAGAGTADAPALFFHPENGALMIRNLADAPLPGYAREVAATVRRLADGMSDAGDADWLREHADRFEKEATTGSRLTPPTANGMVDAAREIGFLLAEAERHDGLDLSGVRWTMTPTDPRATIRAEYESDAEATIDAIRERYNCHEAEVDPDGDVWIAEPQVGHWLSAEKLEELVEWGRITHGWAK